MRVLYEHCAGLDVHKDNDRFTRRDSSTVIRRLVRRFNDLGYQVQLEPTS
jgi:hypothetical protein